MDNNRTSTQGHLIIQDLDREIAIRGLSIEAFAEEADVDPATVSRAVKGLNLKSRSRTKILVTLGRLPVIEGPVDLVKSA